MKSIGLCLSGGGHRASVFGLGVLLYLGDIGYHQRITTVSSVSGGSLTAGFFATRQKALHELTSEELESSVSVLAKRISGHPKGWWLALFLILSVASSWSVFLATSALTPASLLVHVAFLGALCLSASAAALLSGGTFWAWWGSWTYLGLLIVTLMGAVAVWWSPLPWILKPIITVMALSAPTLRSRVAETAFDATFLRCGRDRALETLPELPRYVFCATEMHTGEHAWFTRDLVHFSGLGLGMPSGLPIRTAVQMSANFPVAFPYRLVSRAKCDFLLGKRSELPFFLVLTDGGVHDNTATSWFDDGSVRASTLRMRLDEQLRPDDAPVKKRLGERLRAQIDAMAAGTKPDCLIVVNSSEPYKWKRTPGYFLLPFLGELYALTHVNSSMYNQLGLAKVRSLMRGFLRNPGSGALISIGRTATQLVAELSSSDYDTIRCELDISHEKLEAVRQKAAAILKDPESVSAQATLRKAIAELETREVEFVSAEASLRKAIAELEEGRAVELPDTFVADLRRLLAKRGDLSARLVRAVLHESNERLRWTELLRALALTSRTAPTTFRPLGTEVTAVLLAHGYFSAMYNCHLLLDFPLVEGLRNLEDFERLAGGASRKVARVRSGEGSADGTT